MRLRGLLFLLVATTHSQTSDVTSPGDAEYGWIYPGWHRMCGEQEERDLPSIWMQAELSEFGLVLSYSMPWPVLAEDYAALWLDGELLGVKNSAHCRHMDVCWGSFIIPGGDLRFNQNMHLVVAMLGHPEFEPFANECLNLTIPSNRTEVDKLVTLSAPTTTEWLVGDGHRSEGVMPFLVEFSGDTTAAKAAGCGSWTLRFMQLEIVTEFRVIIGEDVQVAFDVKLGDNDELTTDYWLIDCRGNVLQKSQLILHLARCMGDENMPLSPSDDSVVLTACYLLPPSLSTLYTSVTMTAAPSWDAELQRMSVSCDHAALRSTRLGFVKLTAEVDNFLLQQRHKITLLHPGPLYANGHDEQLIPIVAGDFDFVVSVKNSSTPRVSLVVYHNTHFFSQHDILLNASRGPPYNGRGHVILEDLIMHLGDNSLLFQTLDCKGEPVGRGIEWVQEVIVEKSSEVANRLDIASGFRLTFDFSTLDTAPMCPSVSSLPRITLSVNGSFYERIPPGAMTALLVNPESDRPLPVVAHATFEDTGEVLALLWNDLWDVEAHKCELIHRRRNDSDCVRFIGRLEAARLPRLKTLEASGVAHLGGVGWCDVETHGKNQSLTAADMEQATVWFGEAAEAEFVDWVAAGRPMARTTTEGRRNPWPFHEMDGDDASRQPGEFSWFKDVYLVHPGIVITSGGTVNLDYATNIFPPKLPTHGVLQIDRAILIGHAYHDNFWHFLVEALARLLLLGTHGYLNHTIVVSHHAKFTTELLGALGVPLHNFAAVSPAIGYRASQVVVPAMPVSYRATTFDLRRIRAALRIGLHLQPNHEQKHGVWFTRRSDEKQQRHVEQEEELVAALAAGFPSLNWTIWEPAMSTTPVLRTAEIFYAADLVAGVHGAGMANVLFCHDNAVVLELSAGSPVEDVCIARNAVQLGLLYFGYFVGQFHTTMLLSIHVDEIVNAFLHAVCSHPTAKTRLNPSLCQLE